MKMTQSEAGKLGAIASRDVNEKQYLARKEKYYSSPKKCGHCGSIIPYEKREYKFCNHSCAAKRQKGKKRTKTVLCLNCQVPVVNRNKYCSNQCMADFIHSSYISSWLNGEIKNENMYHKISGHIRRYLFKKHENKCQKCSWGVCNPITGKPPLEINHIDGNHKNNSPENLELICPNCHALTHNYKALNKGNGRKHRK